MPKRRNFVAKNMNKFNRPQTHRDRTKYDRYEDYLKDQLDDMVDDLDGKDEQRRKEEFKSKLKGEEYDPDGHKNYEDWLDAQFEIWDDDDGIDFDYNGSDDYDY